MRAKIALIVVLASFLALSALGVAMAADPVGESAPVEQTAGTTTAVPSLQAPACANGIDDDADGLVDLADPDCTSPSGTSEAPTPAAAPSGASPATPLPAPATAPATGDKSGGLQQGSTIDGNVGADTSGGVTHNQSLGDASGGGGSGGGVRAPSATGGGDQPLTEEADDGSQFNAGGSPTLANPTTTIAPFGPAPIGVPNFVIDSFEIPPFLLPIYQACGTEYGIPWEVLASINKIETAFGTNLNVSSAGAVGWMQFLPSSWEAYGVDANGDGRKDPYNPVDAICAAARYLKIAGGTHDLYNAILAYNHADWYAQEVLLYARAYGKLPSDLIGSLTGLTEGAHFPVAANARYADDISARAALKSSTTDSRVSGNAADVISSSPTRRGINIFSRAGAPVVAVNDGVIRKLGSTPELGKFIVLEDTYGNRYTYAELGKVVRQHRLLVMPTGKEQRLPVESQDLRPRLRALPSRAADSDGQEGEVPTSDSASLAANDGTLRVGSKVIAGTVLARIGGAGKGIDPHINFSIRPAGKGAPRIDPKPILDGWKLLEATAIYRAKGKNPFTERLSGAGVLLLSKEALQKRVLADPGLSIYTCGREDIATGLIDRRVLAVLEYLRSKGFELTITALECGHGYLTTSGNVSEHSTGDAVDIAVINGIPVTGHQGPGTMTDELIRDVLALQGTMQPHQVISLEDLPGETSFAMPDHYDHVHIGYHPIEAGNPLDAQFSALLKPDQWQRLIGRLGQIENPEVPIKPSQFSEPDEKTGGKNAANGGSGED
ncbi:MAG TPA: lytic murein transglycosylase [Solirubrobacterales bacterium]|jgi:murein DD-endopeptidase MepM/ murein hydrolase activator NlpD|nr:lytic murein transglycosylase [Solirubrobacterales bacterium]